MSQKKMSWFFIAVRHLIFGTFKTGSRPRWPIGTVQRNAPGYLGHFMAEGWF
jgi:hypothetical protein